MDWLRKNFSLVRKREFRVDLKLWRNKSCVHFSLLIIIKPSVGIIQCSTPLTIVLKKTLLLVRSEWQRRGLPVQQNWLCTLSQDPVQVWVHLKQFATHSLDYCNSLYYGLDVIMPTIGSLIRTTFLADEGLIKKSLFDQMRRKCRTLTCF